MNVHLRLEIESESTESVPSDRPGLFVLTWEVTANLAALAAGKWLQSCTRGSNASAEAPVQGSGPQKKENGVLRLVSLVKQSWHWWPSASGELISRLHVFLWCFWSFKNSWVQIAFGKQYARSGPLRSSWFALSSSYIMTNILQV